MKNFIQLLKPPENFIGEKVVLVYHDMEILVEMKGEQEAIPEYNSISAYYTYCMVQ